MPKVIILEGLDERLGPFEFVAVTVKVYAVPIVFNPETIMGLDVPEFELLPGEEATVYVWICDPPLFVGGLKVTVTCPIPVMVADTFVGGFGTVVDPPPPELLLEDFILNEIIAPNTSTPHTIYNTILTV